MKVTISFNGTKIVVPCADGEISVREVTSLAATRYKKAIGKTNSYWVSVASLKSHEGGILDADDLIGDVCDDREQLAAIFDEQNGGHYHGGGDGMSSASDSDTKEGGATTSSENLLQVRRGSEPVLNKGDGVGPSGSVQAAIANINAGIYSNSVCNSHHISRSMSSHAGLAVNETMSGAGGNNNNNLRSSLRKTMVNTNYGYSVAINNSDNSAMNNLDSRSALQQSSPDSQYEGDSGSLSVMRRREPLGASGNKPERPKSPKRQQSDLLIPDDEDLVYFEIVIPSELGQLGIHVVPCDIDGRLVVQGIEPGGRIDRDGRLAVEDAIVAINGYPLKETSFNKAQEIFKEALYAKELRLRILKGQGLLQTLHKPDNQAGLTENIGGDVHHAEVEVEKSKKTEMAAGTKITSAVHANNTRKIGKILKISLRKGALGLGFSITTRDNALGDNTPIYIKNILPKGAAIEEGSLKPGDRLLEVNDVCVDGMCQSDVVTLLRNVPLDSTVNLVVSRHSVAASTDVSEVNNVPASTTTTASAPPPPSTSTTTTATTLTTSNDATKTTKNNSGRKLQFQLQDSNNSDKTDEEPMDSLEPASSMPSSMPSSASPGICSSDNYDEMNSADSEFQFPWKQREILTFDIPVHDSERAGLGVSVKGKTSTGRDGVVDLGIFVKSVLHGGAASRDGRLETNDQLVSINGMSLLGKANPAAMETLRKAMHEEGPVPGIISLAVARRKPEQAPASEADAGGGMAGTQQPQNTLSRRDSFSSLPTSSDDEIVREYSVNSFQPPPPPMQPPPASTTASAFKMPSSSTSSLKNSRNPVIDRLMGKEASSSSIVPSNLRNESYYMATNHETWNGSMLQKHMLPDLNTGPNMHQRMGSEVESSPDSVFIEQPTSNIVNHIDSSVDMVDDDVTVTNEDNATFANLAGESLTSLVEIVPFARDQFGRQSMSEKRHATLDAKSTDTYQKRKKAREEREKQKHQQTNAPGSNWKKSASLESLNLHDHRGLHEAKENLSPYQRANSVRVSRNRGCNESFRAAVDRSYENDFPEVGQHNDFVIKDLSGATTGTEMNSKQQQIMMTQQKTRETAAAETESNQDTNQVVMRRSKSGGQRSEEQLRKKNRNSKLLRGLGTMFKIGNSSNNQANVERTKDTKVLRKSCPGPEALTSASSLGSTASASSHNNQQPHREQPRDSRGQAKSSSDIPTESNYTILQQQQNQLRLHPHHYIQQGHPRSHSQPRYHRHHPAQASSEVYEYMPTAMMRPGSRVGIADPLSAESPDYDVLHRLQNTHIQPQPPQQPPPPAQRSQHHQQPQQTQMYQLPPHPYYPQPFYNQYGYHQQALPQIVHPRSMSNLSSGSSSAAGSVQQQQAPPSGPSKPSRPKSNYYEYDYNSSSGGRGDGLGGGLNPASFASTTSGSSSSQYYSSSDHHPSMYSLPRSTSGYP